MKDERWSAGTHITCPGGFLVCLSVCLWPLFLSTFFLPFFHAHTRGDRQTYLPTCSWRVAGCHVMSYCWRREDRDENTHKQQQRLDSISRKTSPPNKPWCDGWMQIKTKIFCLVEFYGSNSLPPHIWLQHQHQHQQLQLPISQINVFILVCARQQPVGVVLNMHAYTHYSLTHWPRPSVTPPTHHHVLHSGGEYKRRGERRSVGGIPNMTAQKLTMKI